MVRAILPTFAQKYRMKNFKIWCAVMCLCSGAGWAQRSEIGNLVLDGLPTIPAYITEDIERYQQSRSAGIADWNGSKGGGMIVTTRFGNVTQLHWVHEAGGYRQQLTFGKEGVDNAQKCPTVGDETFLYSADVGGNENFQLFLFDMRTMQSKMLTDGKARHVDAQWSHDGKSLAYLSNARSAGYLDLYVRHFDTENTNPTMLRQQSGGGWGIADWSPDGRYMVLSDYVSINETKLYLFDLSNPTQAPKPLWSPDQKRSVEGTIMADGGVYYISDYENEHNQIRFYDLRSGRDTVAVSFSGWGINSMTCDRSRRYFAYDVNEGGYSRVFLWQPATRTQREVGGIYRSVVSGMRFGGDERTPQLALNIGAATRPADVYVTDINGAPLTRWTFSELGPLNPASIADCELIKVKSFDGLEVPAFVYRAHRNDDGSGKSPVVISIHGGPEGQSFPTFNPQFQYWVNQLGITVIVPNVRGSSGYGKSYLMMDNGMLRENSVKDIGAILDWVATQPNLDASRVAVIGGSYGGYMSLACMTHFNDRLRCGIDLYGISNFVTFLENTSAYRRDLRRAEYGDERDPAMRKFLTEASPMTNIGNITRPMFIYQGANDPRVPQSESEQMVASLQKRGNTVWYVLAKDEGHSLAKKANRDYTQAAIALFLRENLVK